MVTSREFGKTRLPLWAAGFVALICVAILGLSAWREWEARNADLRNAEIDVTNLAHSLVQHADDTFELVDTILIGLVHRLEIDGTGPDTIAKLQAYLPTRKSSDASAASSSTTRPASGSPRPNASISPSSTTATAHISSAIATPRKRAR